MYCSSNCYHTGRYEHTAAERFWARIDKTGECWLWTGKAHLSFGYGHLSFHGRTTSSHRVAWELTYGPIPDGMTVMHSVCDNPPCCRPDHLKLGTNADNLKEMWAKGRGHTPMMDGSFIRLIGSQHPLSKLTESDVCEMRRLYDTKLCTVAELARRYPISYMVAKRIVFRLSWKHLP